MTSPDISQIQRAQRLEGMKAGKDLQCGHRPDDRVYAAFVEPLEKQLWKGKQLLLQDLPVGITVHEKTAIQTLRNYEFISQLFPVLRRNDQASLSVNRMIILTHEHTTSPAASSGTKPNHFCSTSCHFLPLSTT